MRSIGLDVHKRFAEVAIITSAAAVPARRRIATTPSALRAFASELGPDDQVVLEATMNTWAIAELLAARAGRVVVSNPMRTRAIADAKVKTDQVDATTLAQLLAADFIPEVWVPDPLTRGVRRAVAHRAALVRQRTQLRNRIHGVLHRNLVDQPYSDLFGREGRRWLEELPLPAAERAEIDSALRLLAPLDAEIAQAERALALRAVEDQRVRLLMSAPGIGPITALALVGVIGDVQRFARPNKLVGYLGLDPRVRQSGERPARTGAISRQGASHARGLLIECAHSAVSTPGPLRAFFQRVRARRGEQKAIVAVARKLVVLTWHLLTREEPYRWAPATRLRTKWRRLSGPPAFRQRARRECARRSACPSVRRRSVPCKTRPKRRIASWCAHGNSARTRPPQWGATIRVRGPRCAAEQQAPSSALLSAVRPRPAARRIRADDLTFSSLGRSAEARSSLRFPHRRSANPRCAREELPRAPATHRAR